MEDARKLTHGSLFSGIGGFDCAAWMMGWRNAFHCEINGFCSRILKYHFPDARHYEDITRTDFTEWRGRIDVLSGGFPCQPFSLAGRRKGAEDDRYLWPHMLRAIHEIRPAWVVGENVAGILTMVQPGTEVKVGSEASLFGEGDAQRTSLRQEYVIETVCRDLEREGYSVQPFVIPACAVGAPHKRDRVWIVARLAADSTSHGDSGRPGQIRTEDGRQKTGLYAEPFKHGCIQSGLTSDTQRFGGGEIYDHLQSEITDGERSDGYGSQRPSAHSDSYRRRDRENQQVSVPECEGTTDDSVGRKDGTSPDSYSMGCGKGGECVRKAQGPRFGPDFLAKTEGYSGERTAADTESIGRNEGNHDNGEPEEPQQAECGEQQPCGTDCPQDWWRGFPTQSPVRGRDDGFPGDLDGITLSKWRNESIKAYGNAIVPQVAYEIFRAIEETYK